MAAAPIGIGVFELGKAILIGLGVLTVGAAAKATHDAVKARDSARTDAATCDPANPLSPCYCPPQAGFMAQVNHSMPPVSRAYQARITGFPPYHEWKYMGIDFDGFRAGICTLLEAKAQYAQFLDPERDLTEWMPWFRGSFLPQAMSQNAVAVPRPPVFLNWYFMELPVQVLAARQFSRAGLLIICIYQP